MKKLLTVGLFLSLSIGSAQAYKQVPNVRGGAIPASPGQTPPFWEQSKTGPVFGGQRPTFGELAISRMNLKQVQDALGKNKSNLKTTNKQLSDLKKQVRKKPNMQSAFDAMKKQQEKLNAAKAALQKRMKAVK